MIIVRNSFIAKPGQASKLAAQLKEMAAAGQLKNHRVLTDVTGDFNRVVMEYEVESVTGFEETFKKVTARTPRFERRRRATPTCGPLAAGISSESSDEVAR